MVRMLISEFKADVNLRDNYGNTSLHDAAIRGNEDIVLALIHEFSCDVNIRGYHGGTYLHKACVYGHANMTSSEVEEVKKRKQCSHQEHALQVLKKWVERDDAM